jgi:hypothetical protein
MSEAIMRVVDFKELCSFPDNTLFCFLVHSQAAHATRLSDLYIKIPGSDTPKLNIRARRVDGWRDSEFGRKEIMEAYATGDSIDIDSETAYCHGSRWFDFGLNQHLDAKFAVWDKREIDGLLAQFQKASDAFLPSAIVSN